KESVRASRRVRKTLDHLVSRSELETGEVPEEGPADDEAAEVAGASSEDEASTTETAAGEGAAQGCGEASRERLGAGCIHPRRDAEHRVNGGDTAGWATWCRWWSSRPIVASGHTISTPAS